MKLPNMGKELNIPRRMNDGRGQERSLDGTQRIIHEILRKYKDHDLK